MKKYFWKVIHSIYNPYGNSEPFYDYPPASTSRISAVKTMKYFFFFLTFFLIFVEPAYCYLDPGAGSMLAQLIMGGVAGVMVVFKLYWKKLKSFFRTNPSPEKDEASHKE